MAWQTGLCCPLRTCISSFLCVRLKWQYMLVFSHECVLIFQMSRFCGLTLRHTGPTGNVSLGLHHVFQLVLVLPHAQSYLATSLSPAKIYPTMPVGVPPLSHLVSLVLLYIRLLLPPRLAVTPLWELGPLVD